jgi:non-ribosomal peptide synthetase component F
VLFEQWGCGPSARPGFSSVHQAVEMHAARAPEATAAVAAGQRISYGQLNRQANRLAARLIEQGWHAATRWRCSSSARSPCWWGCSRC